LVRSIHIAAKMGVGYCLELGPLLLGPVWFPSTSFAAEAASIGHAGRIVMQVALFG
jgi:hypothetical protein